ncbi:MAG: 50S ribosomal protein L24 [Deltaproteobacteria bacterium]|nr:50S ribosomal protein L24 [Deltaproteobacteria bacterium]
MSSQVKKEEAPKYKIRKEDQVQVISGKAKGKTGKVLRVDKEKGRVYVEGLNMLHKHSKPRKQGEKGGIIKLEGPINISNVQLYCSKCKRGVRTRIRLQDSGARNRVCAKCSEVIG